MSNPDPITIAGVRFSPVGKLYQYNASHFPEVRVGDSVVVETARGWQVGEIAQLLREPVPGGESLKALDRIATPRDLMLRQSWYEKEVDAVNKCQARVRELRLQGVKVIAAEYSLDGARLTIMFSSEAEEKVELKSLRQDMSRAFSPSQVELRQIGPRDVAKMLGGMGACGLETRCCSKFLTDFSSISIRMAKEQGISLTPSEITGMCGRLRCCLIYEYETYCECRKQLPKKNKRVQTPDGEGKVTNLIPLQLKVMVDVVDIGLRTYAKDDIQVLEEGQAAAKPDRGEGETGGDRRQTNKPSTPPSSPYSPPSSQGKNPSQQNRPQQGRNRRPGRGNGRSNNPTDSR